MKNILFIILEGEHDEAFLYKILRYEGFDNTQAYKIKDFDTFLQNYWLYKIRKHDYLENNLRSKPLLPNPLIYEDSIVLIYSVGGNSQREKSKEIIKDFSKTKSGNNFEPIPFDEINVKILFIEDADKIGIQKTVEQITKDYSDVLGDISSLKHCKIIPHLVFQCIACYIFAGEDGYGKLEHIVMPLMETSNEEIFEKARIFLKTDPKIKKKDLDFDQLKAEIGVVGQLQKSGKSNTAIIQDTKYITEEKVQANAKCQEIIKFIKDVIDFKPTNIDQQKVKKD